MQQHNQHMGDELSQSNTVTQTLESTQTLCNESQEFKKRSVLGHRYSAAAQAIQTVNPQPPAKNSSMDRS